MKYKKPLSKNNFNFIKFLKPIGVAAFFLFLVAAVIFMFFGFNKGFDFTGGTQLVVQFPYDDQIQSQNDLEKCSQKTKQILIDNGIKINSFQVQGEVYDKCFVITFKSVSEDRLYNTRLELNIEFNSSETFSDLVDLGEEEKILDEESGFSIHDITKRTTQIDGLVLPSTLLTTISSLIFALIVVMIYAAFRFKLASALSIVFAGVFNVLMTVCAVLILRIEINGYFFGCLGLILAISVFASSNLFYTIKQKIKDPILTDKTNNEIANIVVEENLLKTILTFICGMVFTLIIGFVAVLNVFQTSLVVLAGLVICLGSQIFVVPAFWALINKKRELSKPVILVENITKDKNANEA